MFTRLGLFLDKEMPVGIKILTAEREVKDGQKDIEKEEKAGGGGVTNEGANRDVSVCS